MTGPLKGDRGAALPEYALMISFVAAVALVAVEMFGGSVLDLFRSALSVMP